MSGDNRETCSAGGGNAVQGEGGGIEPREADGGRRNGAERAETDGGGRSGAERAETDGGGEALFAAVLAGYFPQGGWRLRKGASGMNNTTRFVAADGGRFVLRVYETHRDAGKIAFEHRVLLALSAIRPAFAVPVPVANRSDATISRLPDGRLAALFRYIDGSTPPLETPAQLRSFGRAAGRLSAALAALRETGTPAYPPYYELDQVHPSCTLADAADFCAEPPEPFSPYAGELRPLGSRLNELRERLTALRGLPHQLIHGDLNASNCLADEEGGIAAILDFEFVTRDLRAMETAVCLSDLIDPDKPAPLLWSGIDAFLAGFGETVRLTPEETAAMPALVLLRRMDVFMHFLGRYRSGLDSADIVADQIRSARRSADWLALHAGELVRRCARHLADPPA